MYVLDASVVIKWFVDEEGTETARNLLTGHIRGLYTLVEPDLLIYEVANVLRYNRAFSLDATQQCINSLHDLNLDIVAPLIDLVLPAINLAYERNVTFYDSIYIALANKLGLRYVTADKKLYDKTKSIPQIFLLNNLRI